jgi:hypothetical protein
MNRWSAWEFIESEQKRLKETWNAMILELRKKKEIEQAAKTSV